MNTNGLIIRREAQKDYREVEMLTREAFWNVYKPGCDEHYFVHRMRSHPDFIPELDFVLELDGRIAASILFTRARLVDDAGNEKVIISMGPISVLPACQRRGLGKALIVHAFDEAVRLGYDVNVNFGNPGNYVARGMVSCKRKNVCLEGGVFPTALLVRELIPGALDGRRWYYRESDAAACCEDLAAVQAFDAAFPPKEKRVLPSQEEFYIYSHSAVVR